MVIKCVGLYDYFCDNFVYSKGVFRVWIVLYNSEKLRMILI